MEHRLEICKKTVPPAGAGEGCISAFPSSVQCWKTCRAASRSGLQGIKINVLSFLPCSSEWKAWNIVRDGSSRIPILISLD